MDLVPLILDNDTKMMRCFIGGRMYEFEQGTIPTQHLEGFFGYYAKVEDVLAK